MKSQIEIINPIPRFVLKQDTNACAGPQPREDESANRPRFSTSLLDLESPCGKAPPTPNSLKRTYLECLNDLNSKTETLRDTIVALLQIGVPWRQLVKWAEDSGHATRYVRKLISQILLDLGIRRRAPGAGPKPPPEAFSIEDSVRKLHGESTLKYLRAACLVAKARDEGDTLNDSTPSQESDNPLSRAG